MDLEVMSTLLEVFVLRAERMQSSRKKLLAGFQKDKWMKESKATNISIFY
jgi:hypothetical protein